MSYRVPRLAYYCGLHFLATSVLCAPFSAQGAVLKPYLTTEKETIRLSDVFEDVTKYGDIVVAPAPPSRSPAIFFYPLVTNLGAAMPSILETPLRTSNVHCNTQRRPYRNIYLRRAHSELGTQPLEHTRYLRCVGSTPHAYGCFFFRYSTL